jgi:phosphatidylglycerophosphatase A
VSRLSWPETALVTVLGSGFSPIAPATVASAVTCVIFWFVPAALEWPWALLIIPAFLLGVWLSNRAIVKFEVNEDPRFKSLRRPNPKKDDPDQVTFDEFVGQWITLLAVPHHLVWFVAAFVVFRVFDILKPLGISACQKASAGWGVMLDDLLAGLWGVGLLLIVKLAPGLMQ